MELMYAAFIDLNMEYFIMHLIPKAMHNRLSVEEVLLLKLAYGR
jgi:hypothetical protein